MSKTLELSEIRWERYPAVFEDPLGKQWLERQALLGLARNTVDAYGRALQDFLAYCQRHGVEAAQATREQIALYVGDLRSRPNPRGSNILTLDSGVGLANATLQQRLTAVRLFFDHLVEDGHRETNPVGRGRFTPSKAFGAAKGERGLLPRFKKLPWIPSEAQWQRFLAAAQTEPIRNRCMTGLAYDAGLRREELCLLRSEDLDPAFRLLHVRAETTKSGRERVVPYSVATGQLLRAYLVHRRSLSQARGPLFLSESRRNRAVPITLWTWSKVIREIADRAELPQFSTHTLRHLCLTDLARAGWDLHEIASFAGHRNLDTTQQYIHLSGRDLAARLAEGMTELHAQRVLSLKSAFLRPQEAP
jgi:site-specific recombinase XerD